MPITATGSTRFDEHPALEQLSGLLCPSTPDEYPGERMIPSA